MAYSIDLREKIVGAYEKKQGSMSQLAKLFDVGKDTVYRFVKLHKTTGQLSPKRRTSGGNPPKITATEADFLQQVLQKEPDLTLEMLCERFQNHFSRSVSSSAMARGLKKYRLTFKKNFSRSREAGTGLA
jgi:transposase